MLGSCKLILSVGVRMGMVNKVKWDYEGYARAFREGHSMLNEIPF